MSDLARYWPTALPVVAARDAGGGVRRPGPRLPRPAAPRPRCSTHVDELMSPDDPAREPVLLAAWFHDAVYDGQGDDEERSARLAVLARRLGPWADEVARLVRLTATHRPADDDHAGQVLCDADLGILAADPDALRVVRRRRAARVRPRPRRRLRRRTGRGAA